MTKQEEIREGIAELEHTQWIIWSKAVASEVSPERRARWEKLWIPYSELTEEQKNQDRVWADLVLELEHEEGVVIKVGEGILAQTLILGGKEYFVMRGDYVEEHLGLIEPLIMEEIDGHRKYSN